MENHLFSFYLENYFSWLGPAKYTVHDDFLEWTELEYIIKRR